MTVRFEARQGHVRRVASWVDPGYLTGAPRLHVGSPSRTIKLAARASVVR